MRNSGKWLEKLVADIEKTLLPEGFTITPNEKIFDEKGVQLAEFDIIIEGHLGSTFIRWLIECRDRPSDGAAPGEWILSLIGRKDIHLFDRVTAVSTTGFSPGAIEYAKGKNIDLRTVESITVDRIGDWLSVTQFPFYTLHGNLIHADVRLDNTSDKEIIGIAISDFNNCDNKTPILIHTETGNALSIGDAWQDVLNRELLSWESGFFESLEPNGDSKKASITVNYRNPNSRYQVMTNKGSIHIVTITFQVELFITSKDVGISQITHYTETLDNKSIAQSAHFELATGENTIDLTFHSFGERDKTIIVARLR